MKDLPFSRRKSRRKGLRMQKEGLRIQKKMRLRMMSKKYADALLEEEVKEDEKVIKKRKQTALTATNEATFKSPQTPTTPPRSTQGMSSSKQRSDALNTSASSGGQPQSNMNMLQASPGMSSRLEAMIIDEGSGSKKKGGK